MRRDRRASVTGETEYSVRHVLVRDVSYGQIPRVPRADLHLRAARWIQSLGEDRSEDRAEMLAHHYVAALELTKAAGGETSHLAAPARTALRAAGLRAHGLSALERAAGFLSRALELWPKTDPDYPYVLLELGNTLNYLRHEGGPELEEAAGLLLAAGDVEGCAEAESLLGEIHWESGAQQEARAHLERAVQLMADLPETRATGRIRANDWRVRLLANEHASLEEGERILALTERLGTIEDVLTARINLGLGRAFRGDPWGGVRDLELALGQCLEANSHLATRAYVNLASTLGSLGELNRSAELHREGLREARRLGNHHERWLEAECVLDDYQAGSWDTALARAESFLDHEGPAEYMEVGVYAVLAEIATARGERRRGDEHSRAMLSRSRAIGDPQALWAGLGICARLALLAGEVGTAHSLVDELAAALVAAESFHTELSELDGFVAAVALNRGQDLGDQLGKLRFESPWGNAAALIAAGNLESAGDTLHAHDAYAQAAMVWLASAELAGRETPGLRAAVAFYESVGATADLVRAEALLRDAG